ncbi:arsenate reductase (glutaredoxin) [Sphingoaurantiacus capsulatus]|uniref:Arsenate reductase n=1 Tax=Sphingoaurantiacus capsulatus TaxID=1771310 RepID=A0ABV7X9B8_9SPHN
MTTTIYHNPSCGTSRNTLQALREAGHDPQVVEYLKTPLDAAGIKALLAKLAARPRDFLRKRGTPYDDLGLDDPKWTDDQLIDFMAAHPILIERPIVVTSKGARLCRPLEKVNEII